MKIACIKGKYRNKLMKNIHLGRGIPLHPSCEYTSLEVLLPLTARVIFILHYRNQSKTVSLSHVELKIPTGRYSAARAKSRALTQQAESRPGFRDFLQTVCWWRCHRGYCMSKFFCCRGAVQQMNKRMQQADK